MIKFIILFILFYVLFRILRDLFLKPKPRYSKTDNPFYFKRGSAMANEMVQDPVCKVYVPKKEALSFVRSDTTYFFCSKECLEKFKVDNRQ